MTRAAVYTRVSSELQREEGTSLSTQLERCESYAREHDYSVIARFQEVHTGAVYRERPGLSALRELVRSGAVEVVIAYAIDRLSRNQAHVYLLAEELTDHGARLELVTESFEDSAVGRFIRSAKAFAAEVEREKIAERTSRGRRRRVELGRLLPSRAPLYGYQWRGDVREALDIEPVTAAIVRRIYQLAFDGAGLRLIARALMEDGIPSPRGSARWGTSTLSRILRQPAYGGEAYGWAWRGPHEFDPSTGIRMPDGVVPPIIERPLWDAVQRRLTLHQDWSNRNTRNPEAALLRAGFVRCGYCGRVMHVVYRSRDNGADYRCYGRSFGVPGCEGPIIAVAKVDPDAWSRVRRLFLAEGGIAREAEQLQADDPTAADLVRVDATLAELSRRQGNLARRLSAIGEEDVAAPLLSELRHLAAQTRAGEDARAELLRRRDGWAAARAAQAERSAWYADVRATIDGYDYRERRELLADLNLRVTVWKPAHEPQYLVTADVPLDGPLVFRSPTTTEQNTTIGLRWEG